MTCLHTVFIGVCEDGDLRLADGTTEYEGRVEVCVGEQWGNVCLDQWDSREAMVACRQLGYNSTGMITPLIYIFMLYSES